MAGVTTCVYVCEWEGGVLSPLPPPAGLELDLPGIQSDQQVALTRVRVAGLTWFNVIQRSFCLNFYSQASKQGNKRPRHLLKKKN